MCVTKAKLKKCEAGRYDLINHFHVKCYRQIGFNLSVEKTGKSGSKHTFNFVSSHVHTISILFIILAFLHCTWHNANAANIRSERKLFYMPYYMHRTIVHSGTGIDFHAVYESERCKRARMRREIACGCREWDAFGKCTHTHTCTEIIGTVHSQKVDCLVIDNFAMDSLHR